MSSRLFVFNEERVTECLTILGETEVGCGGRVEGVRELVSNAWTEV